MLCTAGLKTYIVDWLAFNADISSISTIWYVVARVKWKQKSCIQMYLNIVNLQMGQDIQVAYSEITSISEH